MDDVANAGDDVLLFSGGSAKNLAKAGGSKKNGNFN